MTKKANVNKFKSISIWTTMYSVFPVQITAKTEDTIHKLEVAQLRKSKFLQSCRGASALAIATVLRKRWWIHQDSESEWLEVKSKTCQLLPNFWDVEPIFSISIMRTFRGHLASEKRIAPLMLM